METKLIREAEELVKKALSNFDDDLPSASEINKAAMKIVKSIENSTTIKKLSEKEKVKKNRLAELQLKLDQIEEEIRQYQNKNENWYKGLDRKEFDRLDHEADKLRFVMEFLFRQEVTIDENDDYPRGFIFDILEVNEDGTMKIRIKDIVPCM